MGELGVKTLVQHLEKQPVERRISTGETLVTPENMNTPDIKPLVFAPKADNVSGSLSQLTRRSARRPADGKTAGWRGKGYPLAVSVGSESTEQREKGFTDTVFKEFPRITLLTESEHAGTTSDQAQQKS
jgi:ABC-type sugar transport system substrate-binding protein